MASYASLLGEAEFPDFCLSLLNFPAGLCDTKWYKQASEFGGEKKIKHHPAGSNQHLRNEFLVIVLPQVHSNGNPLGIPMK